MAATSVLAAVLLAQSAFSLGLDTGPSEQTDVGYDELANGNPAAAIEKIESSGALEEKDPAALINLGNAYARLGRMNEALRYYRAAVETDTRYDLELADGSWMDSRQAARLALIALKRRTENAINE